MIRKTSAIAATALLPILACLFLGRSTGDDKSPPPGVPRPAGGEAGWKKEFREKYGLKDGEVVKRVAPPYTKCRADYLAERFGAPADGISSYDDNFTVLRWKGDWAPPALARHTVPVKPDEGIPLALLLDRVADLPRNRIDGPDDLLKAVVTGDFVVRDGATPEQVAPALEKVLRDQCALKVSFRFKDAEERVSVLSGKYDAKPLDGRAKNEIELYGAHLTERATGGGGTGTFAEFLAAVEGHVGRRVAADKFEGLPKKVSWHYNVRSPALLDPTRGIDTFAEDTDPDAVLANVAVQTGLTVKVEKRKVRVLVVEKVQ